MKKQLIQTALAFVMFPLMAAPGDDDGTGAVVPGFEWDDWEEFEKASQVVENMGLGWNLGNTLDANSGSCSNMWIELWTQRKPSDYETAWGQPVTTKALIQGIKAQGFNAVRVPVTWAEHIDFNTGKIDEAWLTRVKEVVDWIIEEDMYCLLNTHHDGGTTGWVEASDRAFEKYKSVYCQLYLNIGNTFKDYSEKLILCGTNEMISADDNWSVPAAEALRVVNQWNQLFVNCIRSTGGNNACRNLMIGSYCCSTEDGVLKAFVKANDNYDKHLIMEVHIYSPREFVWEKASWFPNWTTVWKSSFESSVTSEFNRVKTYADKNDMPVIIGEWGTLGRRFPGKNSDRTPKWDSTTDEEGAKFTSFFIKESRERGFTSFYWDTQEIIDRKTGSVTSPLMVEGICSNY